MYSILSFSAEVPNNKNLYFRELSKFIKLYEHCHWRHGLYSVILGKSTIWSECELQLLSHLKNFHFQTLPLADRRVASAPIYTQSLAWPDQRINPVISRSFSYSNVLTEMLHNTEPITADNHVNWGDTASQSLKLELKRRSCQVDNCCSWAPFIALSRIWLVSRNPCY